MCKILPHLGETRGHHWGLRRTIGKADGMLGVKRMLRVFAVRSSSEGGPDPPVRIELAPQRVITCARENGRVWAFER